MSIRGALLFLRLPNSGATLDACIPRKGCTLKTLMINNQCYVLKINTKFFKFLKVYIFVFQQEFDFYSYI